MADDKVVFSEGKEIRCLRGKIESEDGDFVKIRRRGEVVHIAKNIVLKIVVCDGVSNESL